LSLATLYLPNFYARKKSKIHGRKSILGVYIEEGGGGGGKTGGTPHKTTLSQVIQPDMSVWQT